MWKKVGFDVEVKVMEYATFDEQGAKGDVQVGISGFTASTGDPDQALGLWTTDYNSLIQGTDKKIDKMLADGRGIYDEGKRKDAYAKIQEYLWNTKYMIPVAYAEVIYATSNKVEGLECHPAQTPNLAVVNVLK